MNMKALTVVVCLLLAACETDDRSTTAESTDSTERPTVFDPLTDTLDRARGVEDTLRVSADERRRQLEEAEGR